MNKKLILTSILAIGVTGAAHAATNTGSFPNDGKMLEDWTYTNAANETNVGVDGGNVNALANYTWNEIALPAGKYLPADTDGIAANLANCTAGNYCAGTGANTVHYNQSQAQGLTECPSGYGNSAVGSTANTDCYRTCNINNMTTTSNPNGTIANIAHAATLTGNDYYGNGTDTCEPATCVTGYHVSPAAPAAARAFTSDEDIYSMTWDWDSNTVEYQMEGSNDWVTFHVSSRWNDNNCYCRFDGFQEEGGQRQNFVGPWLYLEFYTSYDEEDEYFEGWDATCAHECVSALGDGEAHRYDFITEALSSLPALASCEANIYNITWNDALLADVTANNAATATYGGNINTPVKIDPAVFQTTQKGKRFIGWTFEQQSNNP